MLTLLLVFAIGFVSATIGAIATGSNLISIPALIFTGISPVTAIATTRLSAVAGGISVVYRYNRAGDVRWRYVRVFILLAIIAGLLGPYLLTKIDPHTVEPIVGGLLLVTLPLMFINPKLGLKHYRTSRLRKYIGVPVLFLDLLYGATFGIGGSVFLLYTLIYFYGLEIIEANATGSAIWFTTAVVAAIGYLVHGQIDLAIIIPLMIGASLGGLFGAGEALKHGSHWVRAVLVVVVLLSGLKLLL